MIYSKANLVKINGLLEYKQLFEQAIDLGNTDETGNKPSQAIVNGAIYEMQQMGFYPDTFTEDYIALRFARVRMRKWDENKCMYVPYYKVELVDSQGKIYNSQDLRNWYIIVEDV